MWQKYFRKWAKKYDKETASYGYNPKNLIKPFLKDIGKRATVLDIGCGTGKGLEATKNLCEASLGVEPVEKMAVQAEKRGFTVFRMKGEDVGKINAKFDLITLFASIDFVDSQRVARGCKDVVSKDGVVFLTVEPENEVRVIKDFEKNGFKPIKKLKKQAYEGQDYVCLLLAPRKS
ncbi:MAG: class I SAM-dependent methyltransferase [Candidatus Altiarchaeota archaeon]|nr:class I SAM-dependent methyltransferase [Candidatus Altiarchaeota archaeon]